MITFEKLLKRTKTENIAVHTANESVTLLSDKKGYMWKPDSKLTAASFSFSLFLWNN